MHNHSTGTRDGNGNSSPQTAKQHRCTDAMNIYQARGRKRGRGEEARMERVGADVARREWVDSALSSMCT